MALSTHSEYMALNIQVQHIALLCSLWRWMCAVDPSKAWPVRTASLHWYLTLDRTTSDHLQTWLAM